MGSKGDLEANPDSSIVEAESSSLWSFFFFFCLFFFFSNDQKICPDWHLYYDRIVQMGVKGGES